MLDAEGAPLEEVTVHLLAAGATGDPGVVAKLRQAAADARGRGAPDIARLCLERALAEPPSARARPDVLVELGRVEAMQAPATAVGHLTDALKGAASRSRRGTVALALSEALALCGCFADAVRVLVTMIAELDGEHPELATSLQAALLNTARWDLDTRPVTRPMLDRLLDQGRARRGSGSAALRRQPGDRARRGGNRPRPRGRSCREAVGATPRLMSAVSSTVLPGRSACCCSRIWTARPGWRLGALCGLITACRR